MALLQGKCDVCGQDKLVGVASLPFAAMSVAFCRDCLKNKAFPLWALHANAEMCGGYENCADWFKELASYYKGEYIDGDTVMALYNPEDSKTKDSKKQE